jgi:hypothetical protein
MAIRKQVRIIKKIRTAPGVWRFISLSRTAGRYLWDQRPGYYFVEWWEGKKRRRKANELIGERFTKTRRQVYPQLVGSVISATRTSIWQARSMKNWRACAAVVALRTV